MKKLLNAIIYLAAFAIAMPVLASYQVITRDCGLYRYEIQPVINGTIFRVKDGMHNREIFYASRGIGILPGCQGNAIAFAEGHVSKYYDWTDIFVLHSEGPELVIKRELTGGTGVDRAAFLPNNRITTINGVTQLTGGVRLMRDNSTLSYEGIPPQVEISYLQNGTATKRLVPHVTNGELPWPSATSTMVYFAEYFSDGTDVFVHENMFQRYGDQFDNWINRWSKLLPNNTYTLTNKPDFIPGQITSTGFEEPLV
ncbi:hypothetical protein IT087_01400, partial [Candidatus Uhrbacteria bacterium]|nr:hypothetical protein [Candidatus Uhrbacteria bacterium]